MVWGHFMKIYHVDDLVKPEAERRIDQVRCQLCQLPTKTELKYHGTTTQMLNQIKSKHGHILSAESKNADDSESEGDEHIEDLVKRQTSRKNKRQGKIDRFYFYFNCWSPIKL